jgi:hypothetical protein
MKLQGVHWDGRRWRVILRIDGKSKHLGCLGLLWNAVICANYHIAYLGLNVPPERHSGAVEDASGLERGEGPQAGVWGRARPTARQEDRSSSNRRAWSLSGRITTLIVTQGPNTALGTAAPRHKRENPRVMRADEPIIGVASRS